MKKDEIIGLLCAEYPSLKSLKEELARAANLITDCYEKGGKLLLCGNGGSSADADHFAAELMKSFETARPLDKSLKERLAGISDSREIISARSLNMPFRQSHYLQIQHLPLQFPTIPVRPLYLPSR